jgi:DNA-3-methyladenine glycosylase II
MAPKNRNLASKDVAPGRKSTSGATSFEFDPAVAITHLRGADKSLGRVIDRVGPFGMELKHTASIFGALTEAIVYQQLSGMAAAAIFGRVCALFPRNPGAPDEKQILRISPDKLRGAGLRH